MNIAELIAMANPADLAGVIRDANGVPIVFSKQTVPVANRRRRNSPSVLMVIQPRQVNSVFTGTACSLTTAPGDFDAVAAVAINYDTTATMTIDNVAYAVTESNASKTVPLIGGVSYNALAGATDQLGFVPGSWNGGSASVTVAAATAAASGSGVVIPTFQIADFTPLSSIPRTDDSTALPLVMCRQAYTARTLSLYAFTAAADVDTFNTDMAPYEAYQTAQTAINGCTSPNLYTATWALGASTQNWRILALAFRLRGTSDFILVCGDSIAQGLGAAGSTNANNPVNNWNGYWGLTAKALASKTRPVGYANIAWSGMNSADYLQRIKSAILTLKPSIACYPVFTPNDASAGTSAKLSKQITQALDFIDTCEQNFVMPILLLPIPYSGLTESVRQTFLTKMKALRNVMVIDIGASITDPNNAAQNYFTAVAYYDGTHPSGAGHTSVSTNTMVPSAKLILGS